MSRLLLIPILAIALAVVINLFVRNAKQPQAPLLAHAPAQRLLARKERVDPVCVVSHLNWFERADIDKQLVSMQQARVAWTRYDFEWDQIETTPGVWDFTLLDYIYNQALARGIQTIAMLPQWGSPYWIGNEWMSPMGADHYTNLVAQVVKHYKGKIRIYELGNEPDWPVFWRPSPDATAYSEYLIAGYRAAKSADADAIVTTGGLTLNAVSFLTDLYANGAKGYFDMLAFHPYSWPHSPDWDYGFATMAQLNEIMSAKGDQKPILATEVGWPSTIESGGVSEATQAEYTGRVFEKVMFEDYQFVPIACIYDFIDDGADITNPEQNFGMIKFDYSPKPAYSTLQSARQTFDRFFNPVNP